jgi:HPt (histidine-containing phosphotransfer) domain-containing protein
MNATDRLISQLLSEDPDLRDIVEEFVQGLPHRLHELRRAFDASDWPRLTSLAHQLKGAGGSYGYPPLSELARELESASRARQTARIDDLAQQLQQLAAAAKAGLERS